MSGITSLFQYDFMRNAFLAVLIITPLFGILGTMIVNNKMAFFSDALGHSALTGIAVGVVCGIPDTNLSMVIFGIAFALLLNWIKSKSTASTDTIISVFSSCCIAIGLAILSRGGNFSKYSSLLVGDILSITKREIVYLLLIFLATIVFWILCYNRLQAISLHRTLAKSKHIRIRLIENLFSVFIALMVMLSIKWVGILIINALLILPGGVQPKYIGESEGISFLLDFVFCFFGNCRIIYILLYKCGNRTDDCDHCIGDILCDIFLWQKPLGFCVNEKI